METQADTQTSPSHPATDTQTSPPAPSAKPRRRPRLPVTHCLNCDTPVAGHYCSCCGQEAHDQSIALGTLATELVSEVASFDSKLARTVLPLLFRPGFLTREFLQGRRVRYLSPLKMYLVISALFFVVLAHQVPMQKLNLVRIDTTPTHNAQVRDAVQQTNQTLSQEALAAKSADERAHLLAAKAKIEAALGKTPPAAPGAKPAARSHPQADTDSALAATLTGTLADYEAKQRALPPAKRDSPAKRFVKRQLIKSQQNKQALVQGFLDDLPRMMFVLLPVFALLLTLTYRRTGRLYVSHLIFALHTHSFVFLLLTVPLLLTGAARGPAFGVAFLLLTAYLYAALKTVYGQSWGRTLLAFMWLGANYLALLATAFVLTILAAFLLA